MYLKTQKLNLLNVLFIFNEYKMGAIQGNPLLQLQAKANTLIIVTDNTLIVNTQMMRGLQFDLGYIFQLVKFSDIHT